jgi:signal transduction histidine kinase
VRPEGIHVPVDASRLQQAIGNVVGNAIKFTPAGGRVEIGARTEGDGALFWVSDTGAGITPDQLPRVFERFWQVRERGAPAGTGLGLAIAKGIVEAHGGRIWIESRPGEGTTVSFTIPGRAPQPG